MEICIDELRTRAVVAVADAAEWVPAASRRMRAAKLLRDSGVGPRSLGDLLEAVDWALAHPSAASLPDRSVVATADDAFIKRLDRESCWLSTSDETLAELFDEEMDAFLAAGAQVLRVGRGGLTGG